MSRNWLKYQNKPSFKGVPFQVDGDRVEAGRAVIVHEYPGVEDWDDEDLGRKAFIIEVRAYTCGEDAYENGQALLAAVTSNTGYGLLILPARAPQTARGMACSSSWEADEQGKISFDLKFLAKSGAQGGIVPSASVGSGVSGTAEQSTKELIEQFSENFNSRFRSFSQPVDVPEVARAAAGVTIMLAGSALAGAYAVINITDETSAAQVSFGIRQLHSQAAKYADQGEIAYRIAGGVFVDDQADTVSAFSRVWTDSLKLMTLKASSPADVVTALKDLILFKPQQLVNSDLNALTVRAELALTGDVADFVRRTSLIRWAHAMCRVPYRTRADAVDIKGQLVSAFAAELDLISDPELSEPLVNMQQTAVQFLSSNGAQLPRVITLNTTRGLPAVVIAGMLYGDLTHDQDADLWERNGIENHPLMLPSTVEALEP